MKRRVLFKKSASLVLALTLTTQGLPIYALANELDDVPVTETETFVDSVDLNTEVTTESVQEEIETDIALAETAEAEEKTETADNNVDAEAVEQEEAVDYYQAEEPGNDAAPEAIQPVYDQAKVQDVSYGDVATNPEYKQFSFKFGDDKGNQYECFITGLKSIKSSIEDIQSIAQRIANHYLTFDPMETPKLVLGEFDCIDAEKNDNGTEDKRPTLTGSPYGDSLLCWAATDSNMLTYAGWAGPYNDEDEVFTAYTDAFFNMGGYEHPGLGWFLNGVYPNQRTKNGEPWYQDHLEDIYDGSTQLRKPDTGGYANDYSYSNVSQNVKAGDADFNAALIIDNLKAGNAMGTDVSILNQDQRPTGSVHSLTVFGYIRDLVDQSMNGLKSVFVANSDDDMGSDEHIIHVDPKVTEEKRKAKPNSLVMEFMYPCTVNDHATWAMENRPWYDRAISDFVVLKAKSSVAEDAKEEIGTKDPLHTPDMVIFSFSEHEYGKMTFEEGEKFRLSINVKNMSYASYKVEDDPVVNLSCFIYKDGELYDIIHLENNIIHPKYREDLGALRMVGCLPIISIPEAGEYTLKIAIDSITDKNGNVIQEAYTSNNTFDKELTYTIIPKKKPQPEPQPDPKPDPKPEPEPDPKPEPEPDPKPDPQPDPQPKPQPETEQGLVEESQENNCWCFCTKLGKTCSCKECPDAALEKDWKEKLLKVEDLSYIIQENCEAMKIDLPEKVSEPQYVYVDEELICKNLYQVTKNDQGRYKIEIDGEVINYFGVGDHEVVITTEDGYILYQLHVK